MLLTVLFRSAAAMGATLIGALVGVLAGQLLLASLSAPLPAEYHGEEKVHCPSVMPEPSVEL